MKRLQPESNQPKCDASKKKDEAADDLELGGTWRRRREGAEPSHAYGAFCGDLI